MMKKVIGYVRVSSETQRRKNNSIPLQKKKIKEYCSLNDFDLIDVYEDDGVSGMSIDKRNGFKSMVEFMKENKIDGIVVWSLSRLGRKMKDIVEFMDFLKSNNIGFFSVKENLSNDDKIGSLIMNILSSINEFEVEVIRERIKDVKRNKKENGEVYGRMMYGFDNVNGMMIENKEEKRVIRRVKNFRSRGWSWRKISDRLNGDGVKSKEDKIWYDGSLYNMMRNYS
jgi:site-specific DNA recombinase|tara:strand:+ start:2135 stop:2812 length:678 start_codon:yes stop_codon:yes gene_type:complete